MANGVTEEIQISDCYADIRVNIVGIFISLIVWNYIDLLLCHKESSFVDDNKNSWLDEYINFERRDTMGSD